MPFMHRMRARPKEPGGETSEMRMRGKEEGTQGTTKKYDVKPSDTEIILRMVKRDRKIIRDK